MHEPEDKELHTAGTPGDERAAERLLAGPLTVVNIGLESFANELAAAGQRVLHVDWAPPAGGDPVLADLLAKLDG